MAKDYAKKYTSYKYQTPRRKNNRYLWAILGTISLFVVGLFFLKFTNKQRAIQQTQAKLKKRILAVPEPKAPEPKFDFYNILSQDKLSLSSPDVSAVKEVLPMNSGITTLPSSAAQKSLDVVVSATPEQVAMAEVKRQLEREMGQLTNEGYILVLGDFTDAVQAEQLQAQGLLKGFPVNKRVSLINGKPTYQIFIGPSTLDKLTQEKKRLNISGLDAVLKRKLTLNNR